MRSCLGGVIYFHTSSAVSVRSATMKRLLSTGPATPVTLIALVLLWFVAPAHGRPSRKSCKGGPLWPPLVGETKARDFANWNPQTFTRNTDEPFAITRSPLVNGPVGNYIFTPGAPLFRSPVDTQASQAQSIPPDSPRWQLEGQANRIPGAQVPLPRRRSGDPEGPRDARRRHRC
jgi:hypothetical protein